MLIKELKAPFFLFIPQQVCSSAEDYRGYDRELGVCVCREPPGRAACGGLCRRKLERGLQLQCNSDGDLEMKWSHEVIKKHFEGMGALRCNIMVYSDYSVFCRRYTKLKEQSHL